MKICDSGCDANRSRARQQVGVTTSIEHATDESNIPATSRVHVDSNNKIFAKQTALVFVSNTNTMKRNRCVGKHFQRGVIESNGKIKILTTSTVYIKENFKNNLLIFNRISFNISQNYSYTL